MIPEGLRGVEATWGDGYIYIYILYIIVYYVYTIYNYTKYKTITL